LDKGTITPFTPRPLTLALKLQRRREGGVEKHT
jgi:hypothetical protein